MLVFKVPLYIRQVCENEYQSTFIKHFQGEKKVGKFRNCQKKRVSTFKLGKLIFLKTLIREREHGCRVVFPFQTEY